MSLAAAQTRDAGGGAPPLLQALAAAVPDLTNLRLADAQGRSRPRSGAPLGAPLGAPPGAPQGAALGDRLADPQADRPAEQPARPPSARNSSARGPTWRVA